MEQRPSRRALSRRGALKLLAAAGVSAAGAYLLYESTPWLDYDRQIAQSHQRLDTAGGGARSMRELVRYATLAASGHNAQPWRFTIGDAIIDIRPDYTRRLPVVDPHDRELWMSLGCALENLLVAARAAGYVPAVRYPDTADVIRVELAPERARANLLSDAIPLRQNTRSAYDGRAIPTADLNQLVRLPAEPGVTLRLITDVAAREQVLEYVIQGNRRQYGSPEFVQELVRWLRFNRREALASRDGLFSRSSGNPEAPRWLGRLIVGGTTPDQQAEADAVKLRSSPAAIVIASEADDRATWVRTGQVYERLALTTTVLGISSALLNQPIEVPEIRAEFQRAMGLAASPQLLMRLGYAHAMPRSARRPVEDVIDYGCS